MCGKGNPKMKKLIILILLVGLVGCAHYSNSETTEYYTSEAPPSATSTQATTVPSDSFKKYPDHVFNAKEYIEGMSKGGHNLLIWRDPSVNFSQYNSVEITEFGGRLLPEQNVFSYNPYIAHFNSVFKSSFRPSQKESPDALLIEGAVVECKPGSRALRFWIGFGAGKAACAVVCEVYEPGKANPCIRIYTRDTASLGITSGTGAGTGGDSVLMLNNIITVIAIRLVTTLNTIIPIK
jgi:hypothetical protein